MVRCMGKSEGLCIACAALSCDAPVKAPAGSLCIDLDSSKHDSLSVIRIDLGCILEVSSVVDI